MAPQLQATLIEGRVSDQLRSLAMPLIFGLMATMSLNAVETLFIAHVSADALAAFSFTFPVIMVLTSMSIGLGAGTSSAISRAIGEGDSQRARRLATDAMTFTFFISIALCFVGWLSIKPLFELLGATEKLIPIIHSYMTIWYISAPFLMVPMVCLSALRAMGMSRVQGYLMSAAALCNLLLDPILIFGYFGIPPLGLEGAAIAALITRVLMIIIAIYILHYRVHMLVNPFHQWSELKKSWSIIIEVAAPAMVANVIIPFASAVVVAMVAKYGTDAVAGLGIAMRVEPLMLIVFYALSGVIGPFFGQNLGAGKVDRLEEALKVLTRFCIGFGFIVAVLLALFGDHLVSLFGNHPTAIHIAVVYLMIVPLSYGAYGLVMSVNGAFNGMGRPWPAMVLSAGRVLYIYLPLAWIGQYYWGLSGLFIATALANLLLGSWAWLWLRKTIRNMVLKENFIH